ncbi:MAG: L,D-transpeptidase [Actinobacteria bacterium]|nr:L,D-transpeptidase [Actinomycetota bacterium]
MRGHENTKRSFARLLALATMVASAWAVVPMASASTAPARFPAAGQVVWPSVAVRAAPRASARRMVVLRELRTDFRPQIVLALAMRRVGSVPGTPASVVLKDAANRDALKVVARDEGDEGNSFQVTVRDAPVEAVPPETPQDEFIIYKAGQPYMSFTYPEASVATLVQKVNAIGSAPVRLTALAGGLALTATVVSLTGGWNGNPGVLWYKLNLPIRPFGQTGWIPADAVEVRPTTKRVVVRRGSRVVEVFRGSRRIFRARVAVGRPDRKTPLGNFYVAAKYVPPMNALVSGYALELSAPAGLPDFLKGGVVGIHGTPATWSIGRSASNGCVRVTNSTVFRLRSIVPLGTPVRVVR